MLGNLQKSGIQNNLLHACEVVGIRSRAVFLKSNLSTQQLKRYAKGEAGTTMALWRRLIPFSKHVANYLCVSVTGLDSAGFLRMDSGTFHECDRILA